MFRDYTDQLELGVLKKEIVSEGEAILLELSQDK
jgi:hypothetical protein